MALRLRENVALVLAAELRLLLLVLIPAWLPLWLGLLLGYVLCAGELLRLPWLRRLRARIAHHSVSAGSS